MIRQTSLFLSLTFTSQSTAVVLFSPLLVAGRILWNRVCLSFPPDICQSVFLELDHEISLNFAMVLETLMKLCTTARFFGRTFFLQKLGKWAKNRFFSIWKNCSQFLLNLFYNENVCYLLCSCTNPIFGKNLVPEV